MRAVTAWARRASVSKEAGISAATTRHKYSAMVREDTVPSGMATRTRVEPSPPAPLWAVGFRMGRVAVGRGSVSSGPSSPAGRPSRSMGSRNTARSSSRAVAATGRKVRIFQTSMAQRALSFRGRRGFLLDEAGPKA